MINRTPIHEIKFKIIVSFRNNKLLYSKTKQKKNLYIFVLENNKIKIKILNKTKFHSMPPIITIWKVNIGLLLTLACYLIF